MTSSSFDKMLSQYQGNLPNISDTNYTSELDHTLTEGVNKEIDNLKQDFAARTEEAIAIAEQAADSKRKQLESLAGLIGTGKKLYDYWKAKDLAKAQYDQVHKSKLEAAQPKTELEIAKGGLEKAQKLHLRNYVDNLPNAEEVKAKLNEQGFIKNGNITKEGQDWLRRNNYQEDVVTEEQKLANQKLVNQHYKEEFEAKEAQLTVTERLNFVKKNRATADELNARELQWQIVEDFDAIFPSLLRVKKQLPGMDTPMSYMDATSKDATAEDAAFASVLLRDALADYSAFNQDYINKIGEKRYRDEVFPDLYKQAQATHKKFMGLALETA